MVPGVSRNHGPSVEYPKRASAMFFDFATWLRAMKAWRSGKRAGSTFRRMDKWRCRRPSLDLEALESRLAPFSGSFTPGAYIVDMGQSTQTVGNALKPYGLV